MRSSPKCGRVVDEFDDRVLIGEIYLPVERLVSYYGKNLLGAHLPFNFSLLSAPWNARSHRRSSSKYERRITARTPGRIGCSAIMTGRASPAGSGTQQARIAAMLLLTLRGTPTLYYGDEIGMQQVAIAPEQVRDPFEKNVPGHRGRSRRLSYADAVGRQSECRLFGRAPWLPIAADFARENVANLDADKTSILALYKALIQYRRGNPALTSGTYEPIAAEKNLLIYARRSDALFDRL